MNMIAVYVTAAVAEIGGCFAFWYWLRNEGPIWLSVAGMASLVIFALILTRSEIGFAGRTYAAYGGVYITASLLWLVVVENVIPDRWDLIGAGMCLMGASLILWGPRPLMQ